MHLELRGQLIWNPLQSKESLDSLIVEYCLGEKDFKGWAGKFYSLLYNLCGAGELTCFWIEVAKKPVLVTTLKN